MEGKFNGWAKGEGTQNKPFGFISPVDGSQDVFMHEKDVKTPPMLLKRGARVRFEIMETAKGRQATNIHALDLGERCRGSVVKWLDDRGFGFVRREGSSQEIFVHVSQITGGATYLSVGDTVEFTPSTSQKGTEAGAVAVVGWQPPNDTTAEGFTDPELRLARLADMGPSGWLQDLAVAAEKEPWEYTNAPSPSPLPILRSYFFYTFRRLEEMEDGIRVSARKNNMSFNTGLVTPLQEEIFAFFRRNPVEGRQPWVFSGFRKASERDFLEAFGANTPPLAFYFDDPTVLLYDRRCELVIGIEHVMHNLDRFPKELQGNVHQARGLLMSAEAMTKKRVMRNYKAAIPQYFRDRGGNGSVQLLLPICLLNPGKADLALVVQKTDAGTAYRGETVLTLDMAYNNARLLARPDSEWLQP